MPAGSVTATFNIPYQPGTLVAKTYTGSKQIGTAILKTTGKPVATRLSADRNIIKANANDLAYITAEVVDEQGNVVPYVDDA